MFSGAISSAPRWSVVGLTGKATPCSRGHQLAAAAGRRGRDDRDDQDADQALGQQQQDVAPGVSVAVGKVRRAGRSTATVMSSEQREAAGTARRAGHAAPAAGSRAGAHVGAGALLGRRAERAARPVEPRGAVRSRRGRRPASVVTGGPSSVEESAVDTRTASPPISAARSSATAEPPRSTIASWQASTASSRRWVETRTAAPRARASAMTSIVASTPSGSTPSNGSSSSSTRGSWKAARITDIRRPMPWLKPAVTRCAAAPRSKRSSSSRARSSQPSQPAQPGGELEVLPGRRPRHQPADVGAVAGQPLDRERLGADVVAGDGDQAAGRRDHPGEHPHRRGLAGAVAAEQRGGRPGATVKLDAADRIDLAEAHMQRRGRRRAGGHGVKCRQRHHGA